jgi:RimJ/RimL family protein N-acetyltransferase
MLAIDILETRRLRLREMRLSGVAGLHALFCDPLLMRFWPVLVWRDTEHWVEDNLRRYAQDRFGLWALALKDSDEAVDDCGMIVHEVYGAAETGIDWHLRRDLWDRDWRRRQRRPVATTHSTA